LKELGVTSIFIMLDYKHRWMGGQVRSGIICKFARRGAEDAEEEEREENKREASSTNFQRSQYKLPTGQTIFDAFIIQANMCFRDALRIYNSLREQANANIPGAASLFEVLHIHFKHRPTAGCCDCHLFYLCEQIFTSVTTSFYGP